ncbi:MAG: hypothetical protein C5B48_11460 [Candidatus Rokuibacteriota bacterium]|nr:MAG: hypothetical protein C5B48_11460 [Candidatus Rokubacteria bacterium]
MRKPALALFLALAIPLRVTAPALAWGGHGHTRVVIGVGVGPGFWWGPPFPYYWYPPPFYAYYPPPAVQDPPVYVQRQEPALPPAPAAQGDWYYCPSARDYYPKVSSCPEAWVRVPARSE